MCMEDACLHRKQRLGLVRLHRWLDYICALLCCNYNGVEKINLHPQSECAGGDGRACAGVAVLPSPL